MAPSVRSQSSATGANAATSFTCAKPAGVVSGDRLIAVQVVQFGSESTMTLPTGGATWSLLAGANAGFDVAALRVWEKTAGGSEPSTYTFGKISGTDSDVIIVAVQGPGAGASLVATSTTGSGAGCSTPSVTATRIGELEVRFATGIRSGAATWTPPSGYSELLEQSSGSIVHATAAAKSLTATGATGALTFTASGTLDARIGVSVVVPSPSLDATISPTVVDATANIPTPGISAGQTIHVAVVDATADIPTPGISAGAGISPAVVDAQAVIPTPSVTAGSAELIEPVTVTATADIPTPNITAIKNATLGPASVDAVADIPTPTITATRQSVISPASVDAQAVIPTPGLTVPVLPGELITQDGQVEWGGVLWGAGTSYRVREITGWVDAKPQLDDLSVEEAFRHGALAGASYAQRRIVTVALQLDSISDPTQVWSLLKQLRYDTRTLRDNTLWTFVARGYTETLLAKGKVIDRTGVMDGSYSIGAPEPVITIMCPDPRCYSLEQQSTVISAMGTETLVNDGDCYTSPILRFTGPATNPAILNETLDRVLAFDITLTSGQRLDVDTQRGTVKIGDVNHMGDLADDVSVPPKEFFLDVGSSDLTYETDSGGTAGVEVIWRSAYL